jgi:hypothetical protein
VTEPVAPVLEATPKVADPLTPPIAPVLDDPGPAAPLPPAALPLRAPVPAPQIGVPDPADPFGRFDAPFAGAARMGPTAVVGPASAVHRVVGARSSPDPASPDVAPEPVLPPAPVDVSPEPGPAPASPSPSSANAPGPLLAVIDDLSLTVVLLAALAFAAAAGRLVQWFPEVVVGPG